MKFTLALAGLLAATLAAQDNKVLVDRVGNTGFLQVEASSFEKLTPREQELAYWLSQASIAIHPIIFDQLSRFGLRQKQALETIVAKPDGIEPTVHEKIVAFTKLFWANRGNHNDDTAQKFLPDCTYDEFHKAARTAGVPERDIAELKASLFDPAFEPSITLKSPPPGKDILEASANNFYLNVKLADLTGFKERYPLNSRLVKTPQGKFEEQVYRVSGRYSEFLTKAVGFLQRAQSVAEPQQAAAIAALVKFYQTGDPQDWLTFGIAWVQNNAAVDFANGFIEVYRDARGAKGTSQSFVSITDSRVTSLMGKIADNAQYFEDKAPWAPQYRKQGVKPPVAKAVETVIETGDFHVTTTGDNLPNENEIHEKYGSKSFLFTGSTRALNAASGDLMLKEFASSPSEIETCQKYGGDADELLTAMHEIIGHGSGKLNPSLTGNPASYLKEYYSTLEEARADLMGLWNIWDPKVVELGLVPDAATQRKIAQAMYYNAARAPLTQLRRILKGDTIEEDHQRDRQLIANFIQDRTGAIRKVVRDGKTYVEIVDFDRMKEGVGLLLAELMRIKGEGDYAAIRKLIDQYGVRFNAATRDQVVRRFQTLNLPTYFAGVNPDLKATLDAAGKVSKVEISYPRDVVKQELGYSSMFNRKSL